MKFTFYHADRYDLLSPFSTIIPTHGLSHFGEHYARLFHSSNVEDIKSSAVQREKLYEDIRKQYYPTRPSRFSCLFAANSIAEAEAFAKTITPPPINPIKIYEVFSDNFFYCDMNWMDFITSNPEMKIHYAKGYWLPAITQHTPDSGSRRPPMIEVLLPLPVEIGKVVSTLSAA